MIEIQENEDLIPLYICNVYGPKKYRDKTKLWEYINNIKEEMHGKDLIIVREFNTTRS